MLRLLGYPAGVPGEAVFLKAPQIADKRAVACSVCPDLAQPGAGEAQGIRLRAEAECLIPYRSGFFPPRSGPESVGSAQFCLRVRKRKLTPGLRLRPGRSLR